VVSPGARLLSAVRPLLGIAAVDVISLGASLGDRITVAAGPTSTESGERVDQAVTARIDTGRPVQDGSFRAAYANIAVDDDAARTRSRGVARLMARGPAMHPHDSCHHLLASGEATRG
jgi:hypothetical protein